MKENDCTCREYFQALEDTEVYAIIRPQLQRTLQNNPALQHFERLRKYKIELRTQV